MFYIFLVIYRHAILFEHHKENQLEAPRRNVKDVEASQLHTLFKPKQEKETRVSRDVETGLYGHKLTLFAPIFLDLKF